MHLYYRKLNKPALGVRNVYLFVGEGQTNIQNQHGHNTARPAHVCLYHWPTTSTKHEERSKMPNFNRITNLNFFPCRVLFTEICRILFVRLCVCACVRASDHRHVCARMYTYTYICIYLFMHECRLSLGGGDERGSEVLRLGSVPP